MPSAAPKTIPRRAGESLVFGSFLEFMRDRLGFLQRTATECGDIGQFRLGPQVVTLINSPELAHAITVKHADDFELAGKRRRRDFADLMIGRGLLNVHDAEHRRLRRLFMRALQPQLAGYASAVAEAASAAEAGWKDGATLDLFDAMNQIAFRAISRALSPSARLDEDPRVRDAIRVFDRFLTDLVRGTVVLPLKWPLPRHRALVRALELLRGRIRQAITETRADGAGRDDMISALLSVRDEETGTGLTDDEACDHALTLLNASHETVSTALSWAWALLAQNPSWLAQLRAESDSAPQGGRRPLALQVFKEALRLYPPTYFILRRAARDVMVAGYRFRRGAVALISPLSIHRRPDFFPEPERFDPRRFEPANEGKLGRFAFLPFGLGPRSCAGGQLALIAGETVLSTLVSRLHFEPCAGASLAPLPRFTLRFEERTRFFVKRRTAEMASGTSEVTPASSPLSAL
jgi:cytochrome P450